MGERNAIPSDILDDLSSRFIVNIPEEERREPIRLCFQVELAYWFYLDFFCAENTSLKQCGMKEFTAHIFEHIPFLTPLLKNLDKVIEDWRMYKSSVPTYGAIVLNEDLTKVLLVQSYFSKSSWGFPKGKVNEEEDPANCAVREVLEETGFDISKLIDEIDFIEATVNEQTVRLYVIHGVNEKVKFQPRTRNEIRSVEWFTISDLPSSKKDMTSKLRIGVGPNSFFMVLPFIKRIKNWISERKQLEARAVRGSNPRRYRHKSVGDVAANCSPTVAPKNKRQTLLMKGLEDEFAEFEALIKANKPAKSTKEMKSNRTNPKRQLFSENEIPENWKGSKTGNPTKAEIPQFTIKRWTKFRFDKAAILKCFDD